MSFAGCWFIEKTGETFLPGRKLRLAAEAETQRQKQGGIDENRRSRTYRFRLFIVLGTSDLGSSECCSGPAVHFHYFWGCATAWAAALAASTFASISRAWLGGVTRWGS